MAWSAWSPAVLLAVALTACGGGADDATTTTGGFIGPPAPTTLPAWIPPALGMAGEDALVEVVRQDLRVRGLRFAVDEVQGTVSLDDGRVFPLATLAAAVVGTDPTSWPSVVARTFDALLAP
jgi:hypothetical protein